MNVNWCNLGPDGTQVLVSLPNLTSLDVRADDVSDGTWDLLSNLTSLSVRYYDGGEIVITLEEWREAFRVHPSATNNNNHDEAEVLGALPHFDNVDRE